MAQIPNEAGLVTFSANGQNYPEVLQAEIPSPFEILSVNRINETLVEVSALYNGGADVGDTFPLTLRSGEFFYKFQDAIEIIAVPAVPLTLDNINPSSIVADGNPVPFTVSGTGFTDTTNVTISGGNVTFTKLSNTTISISGTLTAAIGATASNRNVTVSRSPDSATLVASLQVTAPVTPMQVSSISPNTLPQGTTRTYTIRGGGFVPGATVVIGGANVTVNSVTFVDSTELRASITVDGSADLTTRNLTVTNPDLFSSTLNNAVTVIEDTTIIIDNDWLTANGPAPYYLNQANATYRLATDVTTTRDAFAMAANNVTLDLDTHTITFGNETEFLLENPDFESDLSGWDFTNAPGAARVDGSIVQPVTAFGTPGSLMLTIPAGATHSFQTTAIYNLLANRVYGLSFWVDPVSSLVFNLQIGSLNYNTTRNRRGTSISRLFLPTSNTSGPITINVTNNGSSTQQVHFDHFVFGYARSHGIVFPHSTTWTPNVTGPRGSNCRITGQSGSKIQQGQPAFDCSCIFARSGVGVVIDSGVELSLHPDSVMGQAGRCITNDYGSGTVIDGAKINAASRAIQNRDSFHGHACTFSHMNGNLQFSNNEMISSPQGILVAGSNSPTQSHSFNIYGNFGKFQSKFTNGFMFEIRDWETLGNNFITNNNFNIEGDPEAAGRFIHIDKVSGGTTTLGGNVCRTTELRVNQEYNGTKIGGCYGFQLEDRATGIHVDGDTYEIVGSGGGFPIRLLGYLIDPDDFDLTIENTTAIVNLSSNNPDGRVAACFGIGTVDGDTVTFNNLTLRTNASLLSVQSGNINTIEVINSSFQYIDGGLNPTPFIREYQGGGTFVFRDLDFVDSTSRNFIQGGWQNFGGGVDSSATTASVVFEETCTLTFTDGIDPIVGVLITIRDSASNIVFGPTATNNLGQVSGTFEWYRTSRSRDTESATLSNPFEISSDRNVSTFEWVLTNETRTPTFNLDS